MSTPVHAASRSSGPASSARAGRPRSFAGAGRGGERSGAGCGRRAAPYGGTQWPVMAQVGLSSGASKERLGSLPRRRMRSPTSVRAGSGPERIDVSGTFRRLDQAAPPDMPFDKHVDDQISEFQDACIRHPERVVLVIRSIHRISFRSSKSVRQADVAGSDPARAEHSIGAMGKHPIHLRREDHGPCRQPAAGGAWQEAFDLVNAGVANVADVDAAIAHGPGSRWSCSGRS